MLMTSQHALTISSSRTSSTIRRTSAGSSAAGPESGAGRASFMAKRALLYMSAKKLESRPDTSTAFHYRQRLCENNPRYEGRHHPASTRRVQSTTPCPSEPCPRRPDERTEVHAHERQYRGKRDERAAPRIRLRRCAPESGGPSQ